jgi:Outer membrane lipoprotein-sorting protein
MNRVFLTLASVLFFAFAAAAQTTNSLSDAEVKGQQLAQEILQENPTTNFSQAGTLIIKSSKGLTTSTDISLNTELFDGGWATIYHAQMTDNLGARLFLRINHKSSLTNEYLYASKTQLSQSFVLDQRLNQTQIMAPFAGSDFWIADLGLEFFHWPEQKVIKHQERRTRECTVLESTNPDPSSGSYSHVDSWIDDETLGIVHAEAYDAKSKLLKVFDPKSFKKVNGQWELQDMEIRNVQTGSRTWIKFDLNDKS